MAHHRRPYSASHARRTSRRVNEHTVGTHVRQAPSERRRRPDVAEVIVRRARRRRIIAGVTAIVIVLGAALLMAVLAFRGSVGSSLALKDSNAKEALTPVEPGTPYYTLIAAELGAVARPLDTPGPDSLILARVDEANRTISLINIPANLQVSSDSKTVAIASLAEQSDAKLIEAVKTFTKLDIAHYIKLDEAGISSMVDALGGLDLELEQPIDDPRAGDVYLPAGPITLKGSTALIYLRAENVKMGMQDKLNHQLRFTTTVMDRVLSDNFSMNMDAIGNCLQTDMSLAELEALASWYAGDGRVITASLPGYTSAVTSVNDDGNTRFIGSYEDFADLIATLERGEEPESQSTDGVVAADPSTFTVDVQNGTSINGAAAITSEQLKGQGFQVGEVGNAEQQVYEETLVIYKGSEGLSQAKAVIEALGVGRPVDAGGYYSFNGDTLLIIGADFSPVN